jgi:hypothetical protein
LIKLFELKVTAQGISSQDNEGVENPQIEKIGII